MGLWNVTLYLPLLHLSSLLVLHILAPHPGAAVLSPEEPLGQYQVPEGCGHGGGVCGLF